MTSLPAVCLTVSCVFLQIWCILQLWLVQITDMRNLVTKVKPVSLTKLRSQFIGNQASF